MLRLKNIESKMKVILQVVEGYHGRTFKTITKDNYKESQLIINNTISSNPTSNRIQLDNIHINIKQEVRGLNPSHIRSKNRELLKMQMNNWKKKSFHQEQSFTNRNRIL